MLINFSCLITMGFCYIRKREFHFMVWVKGIENGICTHYELQVGNRRSPQRDQIIYMISMFLKMEVKLREMMENQNRKGLQVSQIINTNLWQVLCDLSFL